MKIPRLASVFAAWGLATGAVSAAPEYWPIDLGTLGGTQTVATAINDLGQVVGWSLDSSGHTQAFVWASGTMTGLGFLPGGTSSVASAINNRGDLTGFSYVSATNHHAFLCVSNNLQDLGTFGGPLSIGTAINDSEEITGWSYTAPAEFTNGLWLAAFWWRTNTMLEIPPFRFFRHSCEGYGINDSGFICGITYLYMNNPRNWAFVWKDTNANAVADEREMLPLGSLGSYGLEYSQANAINDAGLIVGWTFISNASIHAFLITPSNGTWKLPNDTWENGYQDPTNLLMRDLGTLDGPTNNSYAAAINEFAWIVGTSTTSSKTNQAFLWRNGVMTNLNQLISAGTGWVLTNATGINEYNEIVGSGLYNGQRRAFILRASPGLALLGTNGMSIADSEPPSLEKGSDFGGVPWGQAATNVFTLRNLGASNLTIFGWTTNGPDATHFQISGIPSAIAVGGETNFSVVFAPPTGGVYHATLTIDSDSPAPLTNVLFAGTGDLTPQTIDFPVIGDQWITNAVGLSATASSGLDVAFSVASGPAQLADGTNLTFTGTGQVAVVASQAGDSNWNPAPDVTNVFVVSKMPASVFLHDLAQTYDGTARTVSATTEPVGLAVDITYDGQGAAPTNAGTYAVTGTIAEANWEGATNGTLVVAPTDQTIDFPAISDQWITNAVGLSATASSGLDVAFSSASGPAQLVDGTNLAFTGTGQVAVVASQPGDSNWNPAPDVTNVFVVSKMPAAVFLHDLEQTYDGTARTVSATTEPAGLAVDITYDGQGAAPTNAGTYAVTGTIAEANWEGATNGTLVVAPTDQTIDFPAISDQWITNSVGLSATASSGLDVAFSSASGPAQLVDGTNLAFTGTGQVAVVASQTGDSNWNPAPDVTNVFVVSKMPASVFLHDLEQTYDGTARTVSATTEPAGLAVDITYDGNAWAPTNAGIYAVTGTLAEANWEGSTNGLLVVSPASQTIAFPPIADQFITNAVFLSALADSGLPVEFSVASGPAQIADPTNLAFTGTGQVAVVASQPGDANWNPAPNVTNLFAVWGLYTLTVVSSYGDADPPVGIQTNLLCTVLTNSVSVPEPIGDTQIVCSGWALSNHEPASGSSTNFTMVVTNNATLVWRWSTNYWLETAADPNGSVVPSNSWQPAGLPAAITAIPDPYYHFTHWTNSASGTNNPFALIMDVPKSVRAHFAENLAIHDTPEWWLAEHGWTNDFDAAALRDEEPDGFPTWQEFVADTDPKDPTSRPHIVSILAEETNYPVITWLASTGRVYQIHFADALLGSPWFTQQLFLGTGEWTDTNPPPPANRYYRIAPLRP